MDKRPTGIAHEIKDPLNFANNFASLSIELLKELKEAAAEALGTLDAGKRAEIRAPSSTAARLRSIAKSATSPNSRCGCRDAGMLYRGWALASSGNEAEGLALAEEGVTLLERSSARVFLSRTYGVIAEVHLIAGRYADGLRQVEKALHIASDVGESFYLPRLFQLRAKLMEAFGQIDETTEASLRRSL